MAITKINKTPTPIEFLKGLNRITDEAAPNEAPIFSGSVTADNFVGDLTGTASASAGMEGLTATVAELNYADGVTGNIQTQLNSKLETSSYTASDVLIKLKTVDGTGSGIDADLLDSHEAAYFATASTTYSKTEVDNAISAVVTSLDWKESVAVYADIATTYPSPVDGWTVSTKDTDTVYRYDGSAWVAISANSIPLASGSNDGKMSSSDFTKLSGIATNANNYSHPTGDGSLHVPATSTTNSGKVLTAGASAGSLSWGSLTASDIGLGNINNTADMDKPVSTATQNAINLKANLASPTFTGTVTAPTFSGVLAGNASTASSAITATGVLGSDTRYNNRAPSSYIGLGSEMYLGPTYSRSEFKSISTMGLGSYLAGSFCYIITHVPWSDISGGVPVQFAYGTGVPCYRVATSETTWGAWTPVNNNGAAETTTKLAVAKTISLTGDVTGSVSTDLSSNASIITTIADDSHNHIIENIDGLQTILNEKAALASPALTGTPTAPTAAVGTNTTQLATTAFVLANGGGSTDNPTFTGTVTAPTFAGALTGNAATATYATTAGDVSAAPFIISATAPANTSKLWIDSSGIAYFHNGTGWASIKGTYAS